jgi:hypothetical protein
MKLMISRATDDRSLPPSINVDVLETGRREFPQTEDELACFMMACHGPGKYTVMTDPGNYRSVWKAWVVEAQRAKALAYVVLEKNKLEAEIHAEDNTPPGESRRVTGYTSKVPKYMIREHGEDSDTLPDSCFRTSPTDRNLLLDKPDSRRPPRNAFARSQRNR